MNHQDTKTTNRRTVRSSPLDAVFAMLLIVLALLASQPQASRTAATVLMPVSERSHTTVQALEVPQAPVAAPSRAAKVTTTPPKAEKPDTEPTAAAETGKSDTETKAAGRLLGTGQASFYGAEFAGRPTANGETFKPSALTAAHRSLPFGSKVRVTNLKNGRSVVVRVNDRGPFVAHRVIDVSRGAAEHLGMVNSGTARVKLEVLYG